MSDLTLTKTRLLAGIWEGVVTSGASENQQPQIEVMHLDVRLEGVELHQDHEAGHWRLRVPVPAACITDGVQTFVIRDAASGETLDSFALIAGEALGDDLRAEVDLLRAELDLLKRAFRRHCVETG